MKSKSRQSLEVAKLIGDKVHDIDLRTPDWLARSTSGGEAQLHSLRKSVALLVEALATNKPNAEIIEKYKNLAGEVDAAGITGLISESEIDAYHKLIENLWTAIEKEVN